MKRIEHKEVTFTLIYSPPMDYHFDGVGGLACCDDGLGHGGGVVFFFHPGRYNHAAKASPELPD